MHWMALLVSWSVAAQVLPAVSTSPEAAATRLSTAATPHRTVAPPDMLADALTVPPDGSAAGQPVTLLRAVSAATDRRQNAELAHAYWQLVEAVADYRFCADHDQALARLQARPTEAASLRTAQAASAASLREAEVAMLSAQHELGALMRLPADAPLPLPADRPHLGPYRTNFSQLFSGRAAPGPTALRDRTLPIRLRAIEARAQAVQALEEALAEMVQSHQAGRAGLNEVLACMGATLHERQAWMAAVARYNDEIADYAMAVASPTAGPQALVGMLIKPAPEPTFSGAAADDSGVRAAGHTEPLLTASPRTGQGHPTPAAPRSVPPISGPTSARPRLMLGENESSPAPPEKLPDESDDSDKGTLPKRPIVPVEPPPDLPASTTRNKPADGEDGTGGWKGRGTRDEGRADREQGQGDRGQGSGVREGGGNAVVTPALYQALAGASPGERTRQLTMALCWDRMLPKESGRPLRLEECLRGRAADHRTVIKSYWRLQRRAAEYQVLAEQAQWLEALSPGSAGEGSTRPPAQLRAAQAATKASADEARAALLEAQFALAGQIGHIANPAWPLASTVPRSGPYAVKSPSQSPGSADPWALRRLTAVIPGLAEALQRHATAVVEADAARAAALAGYQAGSESLDHALTAISRQTTQTLGFLGTLARYNQAIAEQALLVLPPETPAEQLVAALVAEP